MKNLHLKFVLFISLGLFIACPPESIFGCMDESACNYNPEATEEDNTCNNPLDNPLEITFIEENVSGLVGAILPAQIYLRNSSCDAIDDIIVQMGFHNANADSYFCFNDQCFTSSVLVSPVPLSLASFEEDDFFKGYLIAQEPGTYSVNYTFSSESLSQSTEVTITYEVN